jgi:hypothetical protein
MLMLRAVTEDSRQGMSILVHQHINNGSPFGILGREDKPYLNER